MNITRSRITYSCAAPVQEWPRQDLIQAFAYAKDPVSLKEYVFCSQADPTGRGDVEDTYFHRHLLTGHTLKYLDTMTLRGGGHNQNFHVRISAVGNPWIWAGVEQYDAKGKIKATKVARFLYRKGIITHFSKDFAYVAAGPGSTLSPISCDPGKIVIRRALTGLERYTEYDEKTLVRGIIKPLRSFTRAKIGPSHYQGSCAGNGSVFVVNGSTDKSQKIHQHDWSALSAGSVEVGKVLAPTGPNTSNEPEGLSFLRGVLHLGKRFNSTDRRVYAFFGVR